MGQRPEAVPWGTLPCPPVDASSDDPEAAAALALVGRQLLATSLGWDALEAAADELAEGGEGGSR
ncbi:hypothetical protein WME98_49865 [Sorangium sp. So ce296]|uniref:hypothetical protein n=1 Tax=Sorangium sp. So ce296 TaxID=3133296 RepID=UPI003F605665